MSKKNLYLAGLLVVLVLLAITYSGPFKEWREDLGKPDNYFDNISFDSIDRIEVTRGGVDIALVNTDDKWLIEGTKDFFVRGQEMNPIVEAIDAAKESDFVIVSESSDKKGEFLTNEEGTKVVFLKDENIQLEFIVGKNGTEAGSTYVSRDSDNETYLVKSSLSKAFAHDNWYDKQIFSLDKDKISKVRFQYPSREFTVEKQVSEDEETSWSGTLPYKFSIDEDKIDEILETLVELEASDIPAQSFEGTGLEKNLIIIQFSGDDFDEVIMIGEANEEELYFAKRGSSDNIYLISKDERDILEKRISDLR